MKLKDLDFSLLIQKNNADSVFYLAYDKYMDELMIKLVPPEQETSVFHEKDNIGFFVDMKNLKVVGIYFFNFEKFHLPKAKELENLWVEYHLAESLDKFKKLKMEKPNHSKVLNKNTATFKIIEQSKKNISSIFC